MALLNSVNCALLSRVARANAAIRLNRVDHKVDFVVSVLVTDENTPLGGEKWEELKRGVDGLKDGSLLNVVTDDEEVLKWFCERYNNVIRVDTRREGGNEEGDDAAHLVDLLVFASGDFVVGDREDPRFALAEWLIENKIVVNVLKQQRRSDCVKRVEVRGIEFPDKRIPGKELQCLVRLE